MKKMKVYSLTTLLLLGLSIFTSCKKDDHPAPTPPPEPEKTLFEVILGKWEFNNTSSRKSGGATVSNKNQGERIAVAIEFLNDSTYMLLFSNGDVIDGKFSLADSTTIDLTGLGTLSDLSISDSMSSFKLSTPEWGVLSITALKAEEIPESVNTTLLCRTWKLDSTVAGPATFFSQGGDGYLQIKLMFSKSGTYFLRQFSPDTLHRAESTSWRWHSTKPNTYVFSWEGEDKEVTIKELTETSLKMEDEWIYYEYYDNQGNYVPEGIPFPQHQRYVFVPED